MTADPPVRRNPLAHLAVELTRSADPAAALAEVPFCPQVEVRTDGSAEAAEAAGRVLGLGLPSVPGHTAGSGPRTVLWCGPGWWLVVDEPDPGGGHASELERALRGVLAGGRGSAVDVSGQRTAVDLVGDRARDVLAHACSLDLHPRTFAAGRCAQTLVARSPVLVHQTGDQPPAYRLHVRSSYADHLARWLLDASGEYRAGSP